MNEINPEIEAAIETLELPETSMDEVYEILKKYPKDVNIETNVAMTISRKQSVYDMTKGTHEHLDEMLKILANSSDMQARWAVAKSHHTSSDVLAKLAKDDVNLVRALVATNPSTPVALLQDLFNDEMIVRQGLTGNPNTPEKLLKLFIHDNDRMIRIRVADNSGTPDSLLKILANDSDKDVSTAAKHRLGEDNES
jgi:hypothetical protein